MKRLGHKHLQKNRVTHCLWFINVKDTEREAAVKVAVDRSVSETVKSTPSMSEEPIGRFSCISGRKKIH